MAQFEHSICMCMVLTDSLFLLKLKEMANVVCVCDMMYVCVYCVVICGFCRYNRITKLAPLERALNLDQVSVFLTFLYQYSTFCNHREI